MREVIDGVEIWNQQYDGKRAPRHRSYRLLHTLRKERAGLTATGGLDLHRPEHLTYPRVTLNCPTLSVGHIVKALQAGSYTFGNKKYTIHAKGEWPLAGTLSARLRSASSIAIIGLGKLTNKTLAAFGLKLPAGLVRSIRSRV